MLSDRIRVLFHAWLGRAIGEAETDELVLGLKSLPEDELAALLGEAYAAFEPAHAVFTGEQSASLLSRIRESIRSDESEGGAAVVVIRPRRVWRRYSAAAAVILLLVGAGWWLTRRPSAPAPAVVAAPAKPDVTPGRNAAVLTLSGGRQVVLDSTVQDTVLKEGAAIVANSRGRLAYDAGNTVPAKIVYNTLTTARGNQYQLVLPDGTRVWLNASSSIRYPTAFAGASREVTITGESYFEVAKDAARPFHVKANGLEVTVLGTSFNINTYPDEPESKTTLVDGSVKVSEGSKSLLLRPGQQAKAGRDGLTFNTAADVEQAVAWKNGLVKLTGASIQEVMRQVSRWYDVDVTYEGNLDKAVFVGVVSRQQSLSALLQVLEATGSVHCVLDENKKMVMIKP
jgi:transmembrane sensor